MMINARQVARILGGRPVLRREIRSLGELRRIVAEGLPVDALERTVSYVGLDRKEADRLRDQLVPRATRSRRGTSLKPSESERVERVARVMALAEQVWESKEDAREFLTSPHPMLEDRPPLELTQTELGARQVEELLWKLEYSLPV